MSSPIFKPVFADSWKNLPLIFHKHYANRAYSNDIVTVQGKMDISYSWWFTFLLPLCRLLKTLVPYQGKDIATIVKFKSDPLSNKFYYEREFCFPQKKPYKFCSYMQNIDDNLVVEFMRFGIGWKTLFHLNGEKIVLEHAGYVWKLCGIMIPLPLACIIGKGHAEEEAISDNKFKMHMEIKHFLFGKVFEYKGEFEWVSHEQ